MNDKNDSVFHGESTEANALTQPLAVGAPTRTEKEMGATLGVQLQPLPAAGPVSELTEEILDENCNKVSSIGDWTLRLLNKFMAPRMSEFENLKAEELKKREVAAKYKFFTNALEEALLKLQMLEQMVQSFQRKEEPNLIPRTIFHEYWHKGKNILVVVNDPQVQTALVLAEHGDKVIELGQAEYGALKDAFRDFQQKERVLIEALQTEGKI
jgi:hypothetical protein